MVILCKPGIPHRVSSANWVVRTRANTCIDLTDGQRDPLPELLLLSVPGRRIEHGKGARKARSDDNLSAGIQPTV